MKASRAELRRSAAIRVGAALLLAAGVTTLAVLASWDPLDVHSDVIGYPTFQDFNIQNYFALFYLGVGFFPLAALGLFALFTRLARRLGLAIPESPGSLRSRAPALASPVALAPEPPLAASPLQRGAVVAARLALVGAIIGLEVAVAANSRSWRAILLGIAAYAVLAVLASIALRSLRPSWSLQHRLAAVNALGTVLTVAGLVLMSQNTDLTVASDGSMRSFHWLPLWLGLPIIALLATAVGWRLRPAGAPGAVAIERAALLLIAVPVALVLLLQTMTGDLGPVDGFHFGEILGNARLVGDGFLPWRDVVLTHGIAQDVVYSWGREVFGDSVWGFLSGVGMIMMPLYLATTYFLFVYLVGRDWLFLLGVAFLLLDPLWVPDQFRLILLPLVLLLLASDLDRSAPWKSVILAFLLVFQAMVTPEAAPAIVAVALVLVAYEWYERDPDLPLAHAFSRTLWVGLAGVGFAALVAIYLAARGGLDDFLYVSTKLVHGHALSGGQHPSPGPPVPGAISKFHFGILALAPPIAVVISFGYAAARVRLRRGFHTADWVMAATAIFVVLYYAKFLSRMDTGHVYQPFVAALPLLIYIVYRLVEAAQTWLRERWPDEPLLRVSAHPVSLALAITVGALTWTNLHDRVVYAPAKHHAIVTDHPTVSRIGYTQAFDARAFRDVERVVQAYLKPRDRFFDFSNTPLLYFYLMRRLPSTRYAFMTNAYSEEMQGDLIDRLRKDPPKLVAFDNDSMPFIGLANWDGLPTMVRSYAAGQWVLDHYKPLLWIHGISFYARRDLPPPRKLGLHLSEKPVTRNVAFTVQPCTWGYAPNFLSSPPLPETGAPAVGARAHPGPDQVTVIGWAGDPNAKLPAREVIAAVGVRVVARVKPSLERHDLVALGLPAGFENAGFQFQVPVRGTETLRLFTVSRDGNR